MKDQETGKCVRCIEVLFHISCYDWSKENRSLYRGLRYIEVPLYLLCGLVCQ